MITVASVLNGTGYDPVYVDRLQAAVERNLSVPHRFVCLSPDHESPVTLRPRRGLPGWWGKLELFRELSGPVVYLDLDLVVTGSLDRYAALAMETNTLTTAKDFYRGAGILDTSLMIWNDGVELAWITDTVTQETINCYYGDGWYLNSLIREGRLHYQFTGGVYSYKFHVKENGIPDDCALVSFHGQPKPHEVTDAWVRQLWK